MGTHTLHLELYENIFLFELFIRYTSTGKIYKIFNFLKRTKWKLDKKTASRYLIIIFQYLQIRNMKYMYLNTMSNVIF